MFKILVVDDDYNTRFLLRELFESAHYTVRVAEDGENALAQLMHEHFDLVVVDVMMPKMDGYKFTAEVRGFDKDMPILMISAKQLPEDRKKGFLSGIDDFMTKPLDNEEVLLHVKALMRRAKIAGERRLVIGEVVLNYDSMTVTRNGETQELPQKEFMLLYKLLSFPGKIYTKIQLMDEIWGYDSESGEETVTVHIARLRKRFEGWEEFEIRSIRGLGYKAVKKV